MHVQHSIGSYDSPLWQSTDALGCGGRNASRLVYAREMALDDPGVAITTVQGCKPCQAIGSASNMSALAKLERRLWVVDTGSSSRALRRPISV